MLFFGYIVTDIKYKGLDEDIVKVVTSLAECIKPVPRLIVGLENAKRYAAENGLPFDILEHKFQNGDMWTFKKTEKREFYEEDVCRFKKMVIDMQGHDVKYHYIDIYRLKYNDTLRLCRLMMGNSLKKHCNYIIVDKDMIYTAIDATNVIGISLTHLRYVGIDKQKVIDSIRKPKHNKVYFTSSKNMWKMKEWFEGMEYVIASVFEKNAIKKDNM